MTLRYPDCQLQPIIAQRRVLTKGASPRRNATGYHITPGCASVREAARRGDLQRVRGLLSSGQACSSAKDKKGNTALHFAAASGRVDMIQVLLRAAADKNAVDRKERTPLHIAAENGHVASMEALLAAGAEPRIRAGKDECSILDFAVIRGHLGILRAASKYGVDANIYDSTRSTALHLATYIKASTTIGVLVLIGANVDCKDSAGWTPLHVAAARGAFDAATTLLKHGANPNTLDVELRAPLCLAVEKGDIPTARALLASNATDVNRRFTTREPFAHDYSLLELAIGRKECVRHQYLPHTRRVLTSLDYLELLKFLVEHGANVNAVNSVGESLLHIAARRRKLVAIDFLVDSGVSISTQDHAGFTPLHIASQFGYADVVVRLFKAGVDTSLRSGRGDTALDSACRHGHAHVVTEFLQQRGIDVNATSETGSTALHHAMDEPSSVEVAELLIEAGARIDCPRLDGWTPLHLASANGNHELAKTLLSQGADKDRLTNEGWTPLHLAASRGKYNAARTLLIAGADTNLHGGGGEQSLLKVVISRGFMCILQDIVQHGADVKYADSTGRSALHFAASDGKAEAISVLVRAGANVNVKDNGGWTALHYAVQRISPGFVRALLHHGADANAQDLAGVSPLHVAVGEAGRPDITEKVDALLKRDANEKLKTTAGEIASDLVGKLLYQHVEEQSEPTDPGHVQLVHTLLARAPAERAWRRRGLFLMCCSCRVRAKERGSVNSRAQVLGLEAFHPDAATVPCGDGKSAKLAKVGADCVGGQRGRSSGSGGRVMACDLAGLDGKKTAAGNFHALVARVLHLEEEGLFRAIVFFL